MKRLLFASLLLLAFQAQAAVTTSTAVTGVSQDAAAVAITGGTINGTAVGATTPAAGTFTTLTTNAANTWTTAQVGTVTALTDGVTISINLATSNNFSVTLGGNRTLSNPSNPVAGQSGVIVVTQDGTGSRTLAYGTQYKFAGGTAPVLTTTAAAVDVLAYYVISTTQIMISATKDVK